MFTETTSALPDVNKSDLADDTNRTLPDLQSFIFRYYQIRICYEVSMPTSDCDTGVIRWAL